MGSCFSTSDSSRAASSSTGNFKSPGRTLGTAPPLSRPVPAPTASPADPASASSSTQLVSPAPSPVLSPPQQSAAAAAARQNAAAAALARAQKKTPTGKLGQTLQAQRAMTNQQVLSESSAQAVRQRQVDENAAALTND